MVLLHKLTKSRNKKNKDTKRGHFRKIIKQIKKTTKKNSSRKTKKTRVSLIYQSKKNKILNSIFKESNSVNGNYDTYIVFFCSNINSHIKRVEELLNLKIPSSVINEINTFIDNKII